MIASAMRRFGDEAAQAWAIVLKDVQVYFIQPPMIMYGLVMPVFIFFSFSVRRDLGVQAGLANLLALTTFFTASSVGPVIIPLERREKTYDRLLTAPMSTLTVVLAKVLVGVLFAVVVSALALIIGLAAGLVEPHFLPGIVGAVLLTTTAFAAFGVLFASLPAQSVGSIMMPSTLLRWPLLFISGVFVPLQQMAPWARVLSYVSPLTYGQDLLHHALFEQYRSEVTGACGAIRGEADPTLLQQMGQQSLWLDIGALAAVTVIFLGAALWLHHVSRRKGL
jgi:ABC-2 type transport system permease protein